MKNLSAVLSPILLIGIFVSGCTKLRDEIPTAVDTKKLAHGTSWSDSASAGFHGKYLHGTDWDLSNCQSCHGVTFQGGTAKTSCFTCHHPYPHPDMWDTTFIGFRTSDNFHGTWLRHHSWTLPQCQPCHGRDYAGGRVDFGCTQSGCHVDRNGAAKSPEACNTCHGTFRAPANDTSAWAPPRAINGDTDENTRGVGAHQAHLVEAALTGPIRCVACHTVPSHYTDPGHLQTSGRAALAFNGSLGSLVTLDGTYHPVPSYNQASLQCSNVYCHGNWKVSSKHAIDNSMYIDSVMTGNITNSPLWNGGGSQADCGTCHGIPPEGHVPVDTAGVGVSICFGCHYPSGDLDKTLHINGKVDVFGSQRSF